MARETELKFLVEQDFELPAFDEPQGSGRSLVELPSQALSAIYYDTEDLRLARSGVTLRHRVGENGAAPWTLKLPLPEDYSREEITYDAGPGAPPPDALALITAWVRGRTLRPVTQLKTKRLRWSLTNEDGKQLAELVDDRVSVLKGAAIIGRFREIEIESKGMETAELRAIARVMRRAGASAPDPTPKVFRALGERAKDPADWQLPVDYSSGAPLLEAVKASIANAAGRVITHDAGARLGDPEAVHQMRVGVRRLRSDLRMLNSVLDQVWAGEINAELRWLADILGPSRDLDVLIARLASDSSDLGDALAPLFEELERSRAAAATSLQAGLRESRYVVLIERLLSDAQTPHVNGEAQETCRKAMPRFVMQAWRALAHDARRLRLDSPAEDYHSVRILAKRARYAAEAASPWLGPQTRQAAERFARRAEDIQTILGEHQDAAIAQAKLSAAASSRWEDGNFGFALGRLLEREYAASQAARVRFQRSWSKFDQKGIRNWLTRRGSR